MATTTDRDCTSLGIRMGDLLVEVGEQTTSPPRRQAAAPGSARRRI
jgi:hypothetical protein